ncbi:hypothetical protein, partial [Pseudomonas sp. 5RIF]|uniref:hypothetical protein n=1 Tax=Pseudomonas sp. 5RIF TaxID=3093714 RepID=UPI0030EA1537
AFGQNVQALLQSLIAAQVQLFVKLAMWHRARPIAAAPVRLQVSDSRNKAGQKKEDSQMRA